MTGLHKDYSQVVEELQGPGDGVDLKDHDEHAPRLHLDALEDLGVMDDASDDFISEMPVVRTSCSRGLQSK